MKSSSDKYLYERYLDFLDVKTRVLANLGNEVVSFANLHECILLVDELYPSQLLNISKNVKGIVAKKGGFTSHSAIICRCLDIPFVVADFPDEYNGKIIIDNGKIIINPSDELINEYSHMENTDEELNKDLKNIKVWANINNASDIDRLTDVFSGVGLFRTEFLIMNQDYAFDVDKQAEVYADALKRINGREIVFRTFDIGDDKKIPFLPNAQKGVSNYYQYHRLFEVQIKALLKASQQYPEQVAIMFPMIESIDEYISLKKEIVKLARENKQKCPKIGMMLETQRALINLESFAKVDFISIGTNDLTSELFNMPRDRVVLYEEIYESLAKEIAKVINFAKRKNLRLCVCGEIIGKPEFAKKAFALGLENVSINPSALKNIYKALNEG